MNDEGFRAAVMKRARRARVPGVRKEHAGGRSQTGDAQGVPARTGAGVVS